MVALQGANSRMKKHCEVSMLTSMFGLNPDRMRQVIAATSARRHTEVPNQAPDGLGDAFAGDPSKPRQWRAFVQNLSGQASDLAQVVPPIFGCG